MTNYVFKSTDSGAPSLTGQAGSAVALLDACLVNGYNSKVVSSVTRSGSVATVTTSTPHNYVTGQTITISGAVETDYNGKFVITVTGASTFTYTVGGTPSTPATGSISCIQAAVGWAKAFSGTNQASYRPATGNRLYVDVDDSAASSARSARIRGYETMSAVLTGTNPFPTIAQLALTASLVIYKSSTADATTRPWILYADDQAFYLFVQYSGTTGVWSCAAFGDAVSFGTGDPWATGIIGNPESASTATLQATHFGTLVQSVTTNTNHYLARNYAGSAGAIAFGKITESVAGTGMGSAGYTYPAPVDSGAHVAPVRIVESTTPRGVFPGIFVPLHNKPLTQGDPVTGVTGLSGHTLIAQDLGDASGAANRQCLVDVTGPWR